MSLNELKQYCADTMITIVLKFLNENIFLRFGVPKAIISDGVLIFVTNRSKLS